MQAGGGCSRRLRSWRWCDHGANAQGALDGRCEPVYQALLSHMNAQDAKQLGSALNTIAYGEVMKAAVRDYAKVRRCLPRRPWPAFPDDTGRCCAGNGRLAWPAHPDCAYAPALRWAPPPDSPSAADVHRLARPQPAHTQAPAALQTPNRLHPTALAGARGSVQSEGGGAARDRRGRPAGRPGCAQRSARRSSDL